MKGYDSNAVINGYFSPLIRPRLLELRLKRGAMARSELGLEKRCTRCGEFWPFDTEFWFANTGKPDGAMDWCRACYTQWRWPEGRSQAADRYAQGETQ